MNEKLTKMDFEIEYSEKLKSGVKKTRVIEDYLDDNSLFTTRDEVHLRGAVHSYFGQYHSRTNHLDTKIDHIVDLIRANNGRGLSNILKQVNACCCDVCISVLDRRDKIKRYLKKLKKKPKNEKLQTICILLNKGGDVTEENMKHCLETPIYSYGSPRYYKNCNCPLHKGSDSTFACFVVPFIGGIGRLRGKWIVTDRKDQIYNMTKAVAMEYDYWNAEEIKQIEKGLFFWDFFIISDIQCWSLKRLSRDIDEFRDKMFSSNPKEIVEQIKSFIQRLETLEKEFPKKVSKELDITLYIKWFKEEVGKINNNPNDFVDNLEDFCDGFRDNYDFQPF